MVTQTGHVNQPGEVYLGGNHYKLKAGTTVKEHTLNGFAPKTNIGGFDYANQTINDQYGIKDQRGGIGIEEMDESKDAQRCWFSDLQLGYRGHLPLPKLATVISNNIAVTAARVRFNRGAVAASNFHEFAFRKASDQSWNSPTSSTDTGAGWTDDANVYDGNTGTYAYSPAANSWTEWLELNIASITIDAVRYWYSGVALDWVQIELYYNSQWNPFHLSSTVGSAGGWVTVTGAFGSTKSLGVNFNGNLYFAAGTSLVKLNATRDAFTTVYAFNATITALIVGPNSMLYIYLGDSTAYWYMNTSEVFVETNVSDANLGIEWDNKLFKLDTDGNFWYTATPNSATPTWTSTGGITNIKSGNIKRLFIGPDAGGADIIYASTTSVLKAYSFSDGLWTDSYVKLPDHPTGGMGALTWRNGIYISYGLDTLKYVPINATVDAVGLSRDDGLPVEYNGEIVYFADGDASLIALVDASKSSGSSKSGVYAWDGQGWQCLWSPPTTLIEDCEDVWNELVDADVTASLDTTDFQVGAGSAKFVVAANLAAGDIIATEAISSKDLSQHNSVSLRIKSSVALDASDLQLLLDNTAQCASPLETLNLPALVADTWTKVVLTLAAASSDTAIVSVGIKMAVDKGAFTLRLDQIEGQTYDGAMNSAIVSSASSGYALYFDHDSKVYYIDLQRGTRNVNKLPGDAKYASSGLHISPWFDAGSVKDLKAAIRELVEAIGMSSTETIIAKYRLDHAYTDLDTGWTTLGTITSNGTTTYSLGSGAGLSNKTIQVRFDLARGSTNTRTPDFSSILEYRKPKTFKAWSFIIDAFGAYAGQNPADQEVSLNAAVSATLLQEFTFRPDEDASQTHYVFVQPLNYDTQTGTGRHSEFALTVVEP